MGDHPHMAQGLPVGLTRLAVSWARPVQNGQAALRLLCARLDHDQGVTLSHCFGVRLCTSSLRLIPGAKKPGTMPSFGRVPLACG
jgi:hypothetical protein